MKIKLNDSSKRAARTVLQAVVHFVLFASVVITFVPSGVSSLPYVGAALALLGGTAKVYNALEDSGRLPAFLKVSSGGADGTPDISWLPYGK